MTQAESDFLRAITMWGSDAYPVLKVKSGWIWNEFWGVRGAPTVFKTKRACVEAIERYVQVLLDKKAGRI